MKEALLIALQLEEEKERFLKKIKEDEHKVEFYEIGVKPDTGSSKVSEVQKNIEWTLPGHIKPLGVNQFRKLLRGEYERFPNVHYYSKKNEVDEPLQIYLKQGKEYFEVKYERKNNKLVTVIYITPYGVSRMIEELKEFNILPWKEYSQKYLDYLN